jgi:SAM-dependent methyltransferase
VGTCVRREVQMRIPKQFEGKGVSPSLRRILAAPAVQALLIQCAAFLPTLALTWLLARAGLAPSFTAVALLQGTCAAALSRWRQLAWWWCAIQVLFPLAILATRTLVLPPGLFLAAFLFLLLVYWSTFRTQVPYFPSGRRVWRAVAGVLPAERALRVIDIGSGLGGLALDLARRRPESAISGIELAPLPWLASRIRAQFSGSRARFLRGDYEQLDFGNYDVVFAYLSPAAMSALWRKACADMRPGSLLLSYEFDIAERVPDLSLTPEGCGPALYIWHF